MILSYLSHGAESTTLNELTKSLCHYNKESIQEGYRSLITQLNVRLSKLCFDTCFDTCKHH